MLTIDIKIGDVITNTHVVAIFDDMGWFPSDQSYVETDCHAHPAGDYWIVERFEDYTLRAIHMSGKKYDFLLEDIMFFNKS